MWRSSDGALCRTLQGHGHWVNVLALNTDYVTRTAAFEPQEARLVHGEADPATEAEGRDRAAKRWVEKCDKWVYCWISSDEDTWIIRQHLPFR